MAGSRSIGGIFATLSLKDVQFRNGVKSASKDLTGLGKAASGIGGKIAGVFVTAGITAGVIGFAKFSSQAAASIEDLDIQFEVLTGSASTAQKLIKTFREEEKKSALSTEDYANAAKSILAFGGTAESVVPILKQIGDVSMGNSERFGSLALAFAQTTAAGRLMGQEVLQFVNAGFNPLEQISRDTGKSMAELKNQMEAGGISVDMVKKAFISATSAGGRFYQAIEKGSAGTNAKINQTIATMTQLKVAFGTGFNEGLKSAMDAINGSASGLESAFTKAGEYIGGVISDWSSMFTDGTTWDLFVLNAAMAFGKILELPVVRELVQILGLVNGLSMSEAASLTDGSYTAATQAQIDKIYDGIAEKAAKQGELKGFADKEKKKQTDYEKARNEIYKAAPAFVDYEAMRNEIYKNAPDFAEPQQAAEIDNSMIDRKIDDYQRRGLSMSKNPNTIQDKVLKIQEQIRDILKDAKIQGKELVWE